MREWRDCGGTILIHRGGSAAQSDLFARPAARFPSRFLLAGRETSRQYRTPNQRRQARPVRILVPAHRPARAGEYPVAVFTGLVQAVGLVRDILPGNTGSRIVIDPADLSAASSPAPPFCFGESISVSGACLTLVADPALNHGLLAFEAVPETLRRTSLAHLVPGSRVNLERSVTPATLLGGHIVQGHVDGLAEVVEIKTGADWRVRFRPLPLPDADPMEYLTPKGSVTLDGVSLTIASLGADPGAPEGAVPTSFEVALIPTTLAKTTLADLRPGDRVNIEFDTLVKTMVHWLRHFAGRKPR